MDEKRRRRPQGPQQQAQRSEEAEPAQAVRRRRRAQAAGAAQTPMEQPSARTGKPQHKKLRGGQDAKEALPRRRIRRLKALSRMRLYGPRLKRQTLTWGRALGLLARGSIDALGRHLTLFLLGLFLLAYTVVQAIRRLVCAAVKILWAFMGEAAVGFRVFARRTGRAIRRQIRAAGRTPQDRLRSAVSLLLAAVALVSACMAGGIVIRTIRTKRLNQTLSAQFSAYEGDVWTQETNDPVTDEQVPTVTPSPSPQPQEEATPEPAEARATKAPPIVKSTVFHQVGGDALPNMEALYDQNRDLVAWLNIPDVIDLPVVYRDNDYYLKRDFYKQANDAGTIFLDEHHPFRERTQNLLLHGHNMKDGTMFGRLTQYLTDGTYIKNHPFINFSTLWRQEQYVIFAVLDVSLDPTSEDFFNYFSYSTFSSDEEFSFFTRELQLRSEYAIPIDVQPSDALLMLSTCLEEDRLVIAARRIRQDETRSELRQTIHMAVRQ